MSYVIGPPCNDTLCAMGGISSQLGDDQTSLGGLFLAGVFNGISNSTPSHRARLAAVHNYYLDLPVAPLANSNTSLFYTGSALDMRNGLFYNRTALYTPSCTAHIEQRWYAHRTIHNLLVHELEVLSVEVHDESAAAGCVVALRPWHLPWEQMTDFELTLGSNGGLATVQGCTQLAEVPGYVNVSCVGLAYTPLPDNITLNQPITMRFMLAAHSSVELPGWTPDQLVAAAVANYSVIAQQNTSALRASHEAAWAELWDAGLEVGGDRTVAAAFNSTLYYILSAVRANQPYGLSPGGLCSNSYDGR